MLDRDRQHFYGAHDALAHLPERESADRRDADQSYDDEDETLRCLALAPLGVAVDQINRSRANVRTGSAALSFD
jgi:hypothetical protein